MNWAYGVTTVPERAALLDRTLNSLALAGFPGARVFMDDPDPEPLGAWGNWWLGLSTLWIRHPRADFYAMFQDDVVCVRNLREYLESRVYPTTRTDFRYPLNGYWNLYCAKSNETLLRDELRQFRSEPEPGLFFKPGNRGRGALALVFGRDVVRRIFLSPDVVDKPCQARWPTRKIDGTVTNALAKIGVQEWVHWPSLVQHVGDESTLSNAEPRFAPSFPGEEFDAMSLIGVEVASS